MLQGKRFRWIVAIAVILLATSGYSLFTAKDVENGIDPPPIGMNEDFTLPSLPVISSTGAVTGQATEAKMEVTLYFKDSKGFVVPLSVEIPKTESVAQRSLEYMVDGGPGQAMLPQGFTALIPKGTQVKPLNIIADQKLAIVDFSKQFVSYNMQDERKIMEAITWTLTGFPTIDKVQFQLEGVALKEMPMDGTPMDEPLSRMMGINIESERGIDYGQSTPVTLYFQNQTATNYKYFVPVTRLIKRTDNVALAAIQELIKGPQETKGLMAVLNPLAEILKIDEQSQVVFADFNNNLLGADQRASAVALQSVILSLTENTRAVEVQVMVNGSTKVTADDQTNYSKPVSRPVHVNEFQM